MATNDLVTRLLLNSSQFDNNIRRSTQQVRQMQETSNRLSAGINTIGSTFAKIAAPIGLAMGGLEAFNKVMNSSQTLSDGYNRTMEVGKNVVDQFFYSLGSGDFSVFNSGLSNMIELAKAAYNDLDSLGNAIISFSYFDSGNQADFSAASTVYRDSNSTTKQKEEAKKTMEDILKSQSEMVEDYTRKAHTAVNSIVSQTAGIKDLGITESDIKNILSLDITKTGDAIKQELDSQYKEYLNVKKRIENQNTKVTWNRTGDSYVKAEEVDRAGINKMMESYNEQYKEAILYNTLLNKYTDEQLQQVTGILQQANGVNRAYSGMANSFNKITKESNSLKAANIIPTGSIKELDSQIQNKRIQYLESVDPQSRAQLKMDLDALVEQKRIVEFQAKFSNQPEFKKEVQTLASLANTPDLKNIVIPNSTITSDTVSTTNDYVTSLNAVANAMTAVNTANLEGAAGWISWAGSMMTATATAITAIQQIIAAKTAEASGAAEAAKTPVVGWLMVGGAIASVLAAMSSIPKFATGGIVSGNSTIGDMNLARVNAGEMILNNRQQKNLFNLLNGNEATNGVSGNKVEFKIKGNELVGVLNNYSNRLNKIR